MDCLLDAVAETSTRLEAKRGVRASIDRPLDVSPTPMTKRCQDALDRAADTTGVESMALHSGAAHDTMYVACHTDAGMLFAPSRGGYSHSSREWTDWADCAAATRVLAAALCDLAGL